MAISIIYNAININAMDTSSAVAIGENSLTNWKAPSKNNYGNGMALGFNWIVGSVNSILDTDCFDFPVVEWDGLISPQNQSC